MLGITPKDGGHTPGQLRWRDAMEDLVRQTDARFGTMPWELLGRMRPMYVAMHVRTFVASIRGVLA